MTSFCPEFPYLRIRAGNRSQADMQDDDAFLRSIPPFLRRYEEKPRLKLPIRPRDLPKAPRDQSQPAQPSKPRALPPTASPAAPKVVDIARPVTNEAPAAQRARIALAFENQELAADSEDIAFQVTLPGGVVRQIRSLAAEKDTTQRAVVLRALRLAGLSVPEGSDIDRREPGAKRQSQA
jgi:hypothetical protein